MPSDTFQHFVDQHPAMFAAIFPIYFVVLWLLVGTIISCVGGWFSLSQLYRTRDRFDGNLFIGQSGHMRWLAGYSRVLTLGANEEGLYLASMFLFRFMHPPLLIPWKEIRVSRTKIWVLTYVTFRLGCELVIPLRIRAKLADELKLAAGNHWPVEET